MRKPSKTVLREEFERKSAEGWNTSRVLNAIVNGTVSKPYEVAETIHERGAAGCFYTFRFVDSDAGGYGQVAVTFRCTATGQTDRTVVHNLYDMVENSRNGVDIWSYIFRTAYGRWMADNRPSGHLQAGDVINVKNGVATIVRANVAATAEGALSR